LLLPLDPQSSMTRSEYSGPYYTLGEEKPIVATGPPPPPLSGQLTYPGVEPIVLPPGDEGPNDPDPFAADDVIVDNLDGGKGAGGGAGDDFVMSTTSFSSQSSSPVPQLGASQKSYGAQWKWNPQLRDYTRQIGMLPSTRSLARIGAVKPLGLSHPCGGGGGSRPAGDRLTRRNPRQAIICICTPNIREQEGKVAVPIQRRSPRKIISRDKNRRAPVRCRSSVSSTVTEQMRLS